MKKEDVLYIPRYDTACQKRGPDNGTTIFLVGDSQGFAAGNGSAALARAFEKFADKLAQKAGLFNFVFPGQKKKFIERPFSRADAILGLRESLAYAKETSPLSGIVTLGDGCSFLFAALAAEDPAYNEIPIVLYDCRIVLYEKQVTGWFIKRYAGRLLSLHSGAHTGSERRAQHKILGHCLKESRQLEFPTLGTVPDVADPDCERLIKEVSDHLTQK